MPFTPELPVAGGAPEQVPVVPLPEQVASPNTAVAASEEDQPDIALPPEPPPEDGLLLTNGTEAQEDPLVQEVEVILGKEIDAYVKEKLPTSEASYVQQRNALAKELVQRRGTMKPEEVVEAIERWLKALPGMLAIYLEQAAANKTRELEQRFAEPSE